MLKRVGVLALMLAGSVAVLQPTAAFAQDRYDRGAYHYSGERQQNFRQDRDNRDWNRRGDRDSRWRQNEWRENQRWNNRYSRPYYSAPVPNYYYAPAPNCGPYGY